MKALLSVIALLQGCAGYNMASMSPEQLEALAKTNSIYCAKWQGGQVLYVSEGAISKGGTTVKDCEVAIVHSAAPGAAMSRAPFAAPTNVVVPFTATPVQVQ